MTDQYIPFTQANRLTRAEIIAVREAIDFMLLEATGSYLAWVTKNCDPQIIKRLKNADNKLRRALEDKPRKGAGE